VGELEQELAKVIVSGVLMELVAQMVTRVVTVEHAPTAVVLVKAIVHLVNKKLVETVGKKHVKQIAHGEHA